MHSKKFKYQEYTEQLFNCPQDTYKEIDTQSLINNALSKIKNNTEAKAESINNDFVKNGIVKINGIDTKLCRILDPDCEACQ